MTLARARRFVQFGLALLSVGAVVIAAVLHRNAGADLPIPAELTVFGAFVVGGSGLLVAWVGWRTLRLGSASQAFARWRVSEAEWQGYVAACRFRETMPGALRGAVPLDLAVSPHGVEVLALRSGFRVGDSFHEVGTLGAEVLDVRVVDAPADMFEFNMQYATGKTSSVQLSVRVPIASDAQYLAKTVEAYWMAREPLQLMSLEQLQSRERTGWWIALGGLFVFLGVIAVFLFQNPPGWAAIGPLGAMAVACVGFVRGLRARSVRWRKFGR
jgi:hypothetical protein